MKLLIKRINTVLLVVTTLLVLSGLFLLIFRKDPLSTKVLLAASVVFPFLIASKGIEFIIDNQHSKAFLSILLLSIICVISIIFVFA